MRFIPLAENSLVRNKIGKDLETFYQNLGADQKHLKTIKTTFYVTLMDTPNF